MASRSAPLGAVPPGVVAAGAAPAGRPLCAAHAALGWPDAPHLALWHAVTVLREHRGDGHVAALVAEGIGPCEALVTHSAAPASPPAEVLRTTRGWSSSEWQAAVRRLHRRGLVHGDGGLTAEGRACRDRLEASTDAAAAGPWQAVPADAAEHLRSLVRPLSRQIVESGALVPQNLA